MLSHIWNVGPVFNSVLRMLSMLLAFDIWKKKCLRIMLESFSVIEIICHFVSLVVKGIFTSVIIPLLG